MLEKYLTAGITKPRILKLLHIIGELKAVDFVTLKTVKNSTLDKVATKRLIDSFLTDGLLKLTEFGAYTLTGKSIELLKQYNYRTKHFVKEVKDSGSAHSRAVSAFLLPYLFNVNHHAVVFRELSSHDLRPDACLITKHGTGYKIQFVEVEETDKDSQYLLRKYDKYASFGRDINSWSSWWHKWHKLLDLEYCTKEQFCFSVICKGHKTFEKEGWEWT